MMQDVGKFMNHQGHYRHTQYIIANSEIFGFSPEQRLIVSALARYLGKSRPEPMDRLMRWIPVEEHVHVMRAVVLLRLAVALNQDRASAVVQMRTHVYPKRVVLELVPGRGGAELEAWSLRKEADLFPRGLPAGALCRGGVEGADGAGVEQPLEGGGAAGEDDAGEEPLRRRTLARGCGLAGTRSEPRKLVRLGLWPTTRSFRASRAFAAGASGSL